MAGGEDNPYRGVEPDVRPFQGRIIDLFRAHQGVALGWHVTGPLGRNQADLEAALVRLILQLRVGMRVDYHLEYSVSLMFKSKI